MRSIWLGFDPREAAAYAVARSSIRRLLSGPVPIHGLVLDDLRAKGLYTRETEVRINSEGRKQLWDVISDAPMATEFSNSRFLVPHLAKTGLALFADCDVLARDDLQKLFASVDHSKAVSVVKHNHLPSSNSKMDGQIQTIYRRKNWSSVMVFNCDHPANSALTVDVVNAWPGRDLHAFAWLDDEQIGELSPEWNWLAGESPPLASPKIVHHTLGSPCMPGYENAPFADEWRAELNRWAA